MGIKTDIEHLEDIVDKIKAFPAPVAFDRGYKEYEMDKGVCFGWALCETPSMGVHKWFNSAGTIFPEHSHEEREWIFVAQGEMHLKKNDIIRVVKEGEFIFNLPHEVHSATFPVDSEYITICVPPSEDFPHVA